MFSSWYVYLPLSSWTPLGAAALYVRVRGGGGSLHCVDCLNILGLPQSNIQDFNELTCTRKVRSPVYNSSIGTYIPKCI